MGEGVVKNSEKLPTSFMDDPLNKILGTNLYKINSAPSSSTTEVIVLLLCIFDS